MDQKHKHPRHQWKNCTASSRRTSLTFYLVPVPKRNAYQRIKQDIEGQEWEDPSGINTTGNKSYRIRRAYRYTRQITSIIALLLIKNALEKTKAQLLDYVLVPTNDDWHFHIDACIRISTHIIQLGVSLEHYVFDY